MGAVFASFTAVVMKLIGCDIIMIVTSKLRLEIFPYHHSSHRVSKVGRVTSGWIAWLKAKGSVVQMLSKSPVIA